MDNLENWIIEGKGNLGEILTENWKPITALVLTKEERDRRLGINPKFTCKDCGAKGHSFCKESGEMGVRFAWVSLI